MNILNKKTTAVSTWKPTEMIFIEIYSWLKFQVFFLRFRLIIWIFWRMMMIIQTQESW